MAGSGGFYQIQEKMKEFVELHPDVKLEIIDVDYSHNFKQLTEDETTIPDIMELNLNQVKYAAEPLIESLTERINNSQRHWDGLYAQVIESSQINGETYLLPVRSDPLVAYYDLATFDRLRIPVPREDWSWEEYGNLTKQLQQANVEFGAPFDLNTIEPIINSLGGKLSSEEGEAAGYLDSEETANAFEKYVQLVPDLTGVIVYPKRQPGLGIARASEVGGLLDDQQSDYRLAPIPTAEDGTRYNNTLLTGLAISQSSPYKELAWQLMLFIVGDTSDSAMSLLADNTLRMQVPVPESGEHPKQQELRERLMNEVASASPASFDMVLGRSGSYGNAGFPLRMPEDWEAAREGKAKEMLSDWARALDAFIPTMY